ncbi:hypothetical protein Ahy_A07g036957 isoform B [Arachis hypogaea]|uniref:Uncharacterized protein n=1 Tax=Arachis hypogaea TaxID=3818 RepID=A0A445CHF8_ARAHY|nr:hypothetical protein Ahy_A07g036957 isoform B [Arachis hypogaea]
MNSPMNRRLKLTMKMLSLWYILQRTAACLPNPRPIQDQKRGRLIQLMWVQLREQLLQIQLQALWKLMKRMARMIPMKVRKNLLDLDLGLGNTLQRILSPSHHILGLNVIGVVYHMHVTLIEMVQLICVIIC